MASLGSRRGDEAPVGQRRPKASTGFSTAAILALGFAVISHTVFNALTEHDAKSTEEARVVVHNVVES